jgi:NADPH-dependent curcumin reductase CurA
MAATTATTARTLVLAAHIANETLPSPANFRVTEAPAPTPADVPEGGVLVAARYVSADPYQRSAMRADRPGAKQVGEALTGFLSGVVLASRGAAWVAGDLFGASLPLATVQVVTAEALAKTVMWRLTGLCSEEELSLGVGLLGMPGATAWGGLLKVLRPEKGQALLVTAASGAVGQLVGQIARHVCECSVVVGTAGGPAKCAALTERFGFTHAIDYKALSGWGEGGAREARAEALAAQLKASAPGLDMVFENVGGATFEAAFRCLGKGGRIAVCGGISDYGSERIPTVAINVRAAAHARWRQAAGPHLPSCPPSALLSHAGA